MKRQLKILMHTHWDREWYFTKDETKVFLRNHMHEVIQYLEEHPDVLYILDGQSVMIDDFLEFSPDWEDRLEKLIQNKQLRVGPWYTQTDLLIVHGESIIRNLYYGIKRAEEFGDSMKVGYAPDTFGHSAQMPQIYQQFGIESTFFWRGFSELKASHSDFIWEGVDGSKLFGINLATGYQGAKYLEEEKGALTERMDKILSVLDQYSTSEARLIMNGHDQMPIQKNIHKIMDHLQEIYPDDEVEITDFESYVDDVRDENLETVEGELTHSKHARIHRTINSTRMDIKLLNTELEYKLFHILEPLSVLAEKIGLSYPHELFAQCYKELFGVHAHDSIGGCNADVVNQDIKQRLISVQEIVNTQIELYMRLISLSASKNEKDTVTVYNFLPYKRENTWVEVETITRTKGISLYDEQGHEMEAYILEQEIVDAGLIDRQVAARQLDIKVYKSRVKVKMDKIDGLSIRYLTYQEQENNQPIEMKKEQAIENAFYQIRVEDNELVLLNKKENEEIRSFIQIENSGDAGDSYDYSPPEQDYIVTGGTLSDIFTVKQNGMEELHFTMNLTIPSSLKKREKGQLDKDVSFKALLSIYPDDALVYAKMTHQNSTEDSRYRLMFNTGINSEIVTTDSHLSTIERPVFLEEELSVWEQEKWAEKPISVETFQSFISRKEEQKKATLFAKGLKEYEVLGKNIYVTLFRTFSQLGKRNLINRPGRPSGIEIPTPDNQMPDQDFTFEFAFSFDKEINEAKASKEFLTPIMGYQLKEFNRFNINAPNMRKKITYALEENWNGAVISAVKFTEDTNDLFIRVFNPLKEPIELVFDHKVFKATPLEERKEKIERYQLKPQGILNVIIEE